MHREFNLINVNFTELFVCIDNWENRYLVLLTNVSKENFTIIPISIVNLKQFICGEITLTEVFKTSDIIYFVETQDDNIVNDKVSIINYDNIQDDEGWFEGEEYRLDKTFIDNVDEYLEKLTGV